MFTRLLEKLRRSPGHAIVSPPSGRSARPASPSAAENDSRLPGWKPGDTILGRYRVEEKISGAMGHVYICEHLGWGIKIAIKSPRPEVLADSEGVKRILREASSWARLDMHPHIASCYYVLAIAKVPHLFIEYVDGGDLSAWIKAGRCRDMRTSLSLAIQFCHGMEFTHGQGIVHRDIKPQNILVSKDAVVKITDFGIHLPIAKADDELEVLSAFEDEEEATVGFRGSPAYASPEQLRSAHDVDERTDIFSFGLCLWLMICGYKPFKNNSLRHAIPEPEPPPGSALPPVLVEALKRCVAYDPADRFANFTELRQALNEAYESVYHAACPYAELGNIDLRADSLNNRAVSLYELERTDEAKTCLEEALAIDDLLPEAIYNLVLLRWKTGTLNRENALRQLNAACMRLPEIDLFRPLMETMQGSEPDGSVRRPELRLCLPKKSLSLYRDAQLNRAIKRNLLDHLKKKNYQACHDVLLPAWRSNAFRKDQVFNGAYGNLLSAGPAKGAVVGAQRYMTRPGFPAESAVGCYLPGAGLLAGTDRDGNTVFLLETRTTRPGRSLSTAGQKISCLAASPTGNMLCAGSDRGTLLLFDLDKGVQPVSLRAHDGAVTCLAFHPGGRRLVSGGQDAMICHRGIDAEKTVSRKPPVNSPPATLVFFDKGQRLASGHTDGSLLFWESGGAECSKITRAHDEPLLAVTGDPGGTLLASASLGGEIKVWDGKTGRCLKTVPRQKEALAAIHLLPDSHFLVAGFAEDVIRILDVQTGKWGLVMDGRGNGLRGLATGPRPHFFHSIHADGTVALWLVVYELGFRT